MLRTVSAIASPCVSTDTLVPRAAKPCRRWFAMLYAFASTVAFTHALMALLQVAGELQSPMLQIVKNSGMKYPKNHRGRPCSGARWVEMADQFTLDFLKCAFSTPTMCAVVRVPN